MKILISSDPHAKLSNLDSFVCYLSKLRELESKADLAVIAGDLFDGHALIRSELMTCWLEFLAGIKIPYYLIVGNHDKISPSSGVHALEAFKFLKDVHVVCPNDIVYSNSTVSSSNLAMVSHNTAEDFKRLVMSIDSSFKILFCHQLFQGAQFDNGFYSPDGIPIEVVSRYKLVIAGDVHKEQQIGNVWYTGSPFSMTFADAGQEKGVWIFDTETMERTKIKLNLPLYIVQSFQGVDNIIPWIKGQDCNNNFKVSIIDTRNNLQMFQASAPWKEVKEEYNVTIVPQYSDAVEYAHKISDTLSPLQMLERYVLDIIQISGIDRTRLLKDSSTYLK